jgi:hypothetical protein
MPDIRNPILDDESVVLPLPPTCVTAEMEMEIYARFMRYLRHAPGNSMDMKILSAIQFTADMLDHSDAFVAKILVDHGLRASRKAFPESYIEHIDQSMKRCAWTIGGPSFPARSLQRYWAGLDGVVM